MLLRLSAARFMYCGIVEITRLVLTPSKRCFQLTCSFTWNTGSKQTQKGRAVLKMRVRRSISVLPSRHCRRISMKPGLVEPCHDMCLPDYCVTPRFHSLVRGSKFKVSLGRDASRRTTPMIGPCTFLGVYGPYMLAHLVLKDGQMFLFPAAVNWEQAEESFSRSCSGVMLLKLACALIRYGIHLQPRLYIDCSTNAWALGYLATLNTNS